MQVYQIDLHYHAGQERGDGVTLRDYVEFAYQTGRKVVGITDHINLYAPPERPEKARHYPQTLAGLCQFRRELDALRGDYPAMRLLFAPELTPTTDHRTLDAQISAISDYFICEPVTFCKGSPAENTAGMVKQLARVQDVARHTNRPAFLAHPFRSQMHAQMTAPNLACFDLRREYAGPASLTDAMVNAFFNFDLAVFGAKAAELDVSIEINGETLYRAGTVNNPLYRDLLFRGYDLMLRQGASFVPSSDLHGCRMGRVGTPVPADIFQRLGLGAGDIPFLKKINVSP